MPGSGGAGLGLAIVRSLVTAHCGQVELLSAPGQGATFRMLLAQPATTADPRGPEVGLRHLVRRVTRLRHL
ncbi:ATP-binding protein [Actinacidiphila soli]|uniref:ATP-binding protein n=1 Tax=Actinacidiphila soli TaxID=2487275 RepID=UPI000FCAFEFE|nr:ATP-binding protein [Actinacidiphila soli]